MVEKDLWDLIAGKISCFSKDYPVLKSFSVSGHECSVVDETLSVCRLQTDDPTKEPTQPPEEDSGSSPIAFIGAGVGFLLLLVAILVFARRRTNKKQQLVEEVANKRFEVESSVTKATFDRRPAAKAAGEGSSNGSESPGDTTESEGSSKSSSVGHSRTGKAKSGELPSFLEDGEWKEVSL